MNGVFTYTNPRRIRWGAGSVAELASELSSRRAGHVALITTKSLLPHAGRLDFDFVATETIGQHAPVAEIEAAISQAAAKAVDAVVSFGGGSAIDAAKIVALRAGELLERKLHHFAIPTTLSAAELASGAGYTNEAGDKASVSDETMLVDCVIYDAKLTLLTPLELWLSTGIRALDHAIEGFLVEGDHPFNDTLAAEGIHRLMHSLRATKANPDDLDARTESQLGAWFSYTLPAAARGLSHVMGKQIGARHSIPHGVTSCLLLPHVMRYLAAHQRARMDTLAGVMGADPAQVVEQFVASLGLPQHLAEYGVGEPELRRAATELGGKYPAEDLVEIYLAAL